MHGRRLLRAGHDVQRDGDAELGHRLEDALVRLPRRGCLLVIPLPRGKAVGGLGERSDPALDTLQRLQNPLALLGNCRNLDELARISFLNFDIHPRERGCTGGTQALGHGRLDATKDRLEGRQAALHGLVEQLVVVPELGNLALGLAAEQLGPGGLVALDDGVALELLLDDVQDGHVALQRGDALGELLVFSERHQQLRLSLLL